MLNLGKQGCKHFQAPRINATSARNTDKTLAGFNEKALPESGFYKKIGKNFSSLKLLIR
jgi:hypothetical protein